MTQEELGGSYFPEQECKIINAMIQDEAKASYQLKSLSSVADCVAYTILNAKKEVVIFSDHLDRKIFGTRVVTEALKKKLASDTTLNYDVHLKVGMGSISQVLILLANVKTKSKLVLFSDADMTKECIVADGKFGLEYDAHSACFHCNSEWGGALSAKIKGDTGYVLKETIQDTTLFMPIQVKKYEGKTLPVNQNQRGEE